MCLERETPWEVERDEEWDRVVDVEWAKKYVETLQTGKDKDEALNEKLDRKWEEFYRAVEEGGEERGKMRVTWPAALILATRKVRGSWWTAHVGR